MLTLTGFGLENIHRIQHEVLTALLADFREMVELLVVVDEKPRWCRHASYMGPHRCESMILGSMTFCLTRAGLWPLPDGPADMELSIRQLHRTLEGLVIHDIGQANKRDPDHTECNPKEFLGSRMKVALANVADPVQESHRERLRGRPVSQVE